MVPNEYVLSNTTRCYAAPGTHPCATCHLSVASYLMERLLTHLGSREYFSDPCCNEGLTWTGSCLPRDVFARNYRGNDFLVAGQCAASACSEQVANSLASGAETLC